MLTVVTWWWHTPGYRSTFTAHCVNVLQRMVARHYRAPHRFVCVTNEPRAGLDAAVDTVPLDTRWAAVPSSVPGVYQRLQAFAPDVRATLGERFVSLDLDCVITGDVTPLWNRPEPFVIWRDPTPAHHVYNASMFLLTAGARRQVFDCFDPQTSPQQADAWLGCEGWEQGWISYALGRGEPIWTQADGVYSFRIDIDEPHRPLPDNARIVFFHGRFDPWMSQVQQRHPWVAECWR